MQSLQAFNNLIQSQRYVTKTLSKEFFNDVFRNHKQTIGMDIVYPFDQSILRKLTDDSQIILDSLKHSDLWSKYLPNHNDSQYTMDLVNTSSGGQLISAYYKIFQAMKTFKEKAYEEKKEADLNSRHTALDANQSFVPFNSRATLATSHYSTLSKGKSSKRLIQAYKEPLELIEELDSGSNGYDNKVAEYLKLEYPFQSKFNFSLHLDKSLLQEIEGKMNLILIFNIHMEEISSHSKDQAYIQLVKLKLKNKEVIKSLFKETKTTYLWHSMVFDLTLHSLESMKITPQFKEIRSLTNFIRHEKKDIINKEEDFNNFYINKIIPMVKNSQIKKLYSLEQDTYLTEEHYCQYCQRNGIEECCVILDCTHLICAPCMTRYHYEDCRICDKSFSWSQDIIKQIQSFKAVQIDDQLKGLCIGNKRRFLDSGLSSKSSLHSEGVRLPPQLQSLHQSSLSDNSQQEQMIE